LEHKISAAFFDHLFYRLFQPEGEAQRHRIYSANIGLLTKSHGIIVPHHLRKSANDNFFLPVNNLINLSNCKQEIRHPRLFLSETRPTAA
jgi:hypothetical protein